MPFDQEYLRALAGEAWESSILDTLCRYIRIPCKSPLFDPQWQAHGYLDEAVALVETWCRERKISGLRVEVARLPGRTPLLLVEVPATHGEADTVLLYGHLDKQPEFSGWSPGTGPFEPVRIDDRLYGRGSADDGYSVFAALSAIEMLQTLQVPHARCVVLIEACEESGSYDLPAYIDHLSLRIGAVSLVVCLDSGCGDYERLWCTTSLRGLLMGDLCVEVLTEGVHSGDASGIVASSFRIARTLLSRLEDERTGRIRLPALHDKIPRARSAEARATAKVLKRGVYESFPFVAGMRPMHAAPAELLLQRNFRPTLSVTAASGLPDLGSAGNVLRPSTTLKLSIRLPPTCDAARATAEVKRILEKDPPYGAKVRFACEKGSPGWDAPTFAPWLSASLQAASRANFGKPACFMGEGGSIPFMALLGEKFPKAQFLITGVLGPHSNAHGPNEFLHVPTAKRLTACVAQVLADHCARAADDDAKPSRPPRKRRATKPLRRRQRRVSH